MQLFRKAMVVFLLLASSLLCGGAGALLGLCGPFTDVSDAVFCPFVLEIFTLAITTGTTPATYSPADNVSRLQMAAFLSRTVDGILQRAGSRAIAGRFWTPRDTANLGLTTLGMFAGPRLVASDGADLWVSIPNLDQVARVRASDGKFLETWTGATEAYGVLSAIGKIFVTGATSPGRLYRIDPDKAAGSVTTIASNLGTFPSLIAYDGSRIWTGNSGGVSFVTPGPAIPWTTTTVTTGILPGVRGILFDGANIWISGLTGLASHALQKLDGNGALLQSVTVGQYPGQPAFDGVNIWVPNRDSASVSVVRASTGAVLATLTGNGLLTGGPEAAAFDGQRVLITVGGPAVVSLWKAADLTPLGSFSTGAVTDPFGVCSDGLNFWIALTLGNGLARF